MNEWDEFGAMSRSRFLGLTAGVASIGAVGLVGCGDDDDPKSATASAAAKPGGTLRVGIGGGSNKDTLEPQKASTHALQVRLRSLYEPLVTYDENFKVVPAVAEELVQEDPKTWVATIRDGITFHNGKPVEAEDVIFSLRRIIAPESGLSGSAGLSVIDGKKLEAVDARTVRIHLKSPAVVLDQLLAEYYNTIIPRDFDVKNPVGTGPFKYESFTPGQQSKFTKFADYWQEGRPILDALVITDIFDDSARVNALIAGQVDVINAVPGGQVKVLEAQSNKVTVLETESGGFLPITLLCDSGPLKDPKVRQALKLVIDRAQMVSAGLDGHGRIANDLYAPYDPVYAKDIPQREQDIEQAKSLLASAGASDLSFTISVSPVAGGAVETAELFSQQAKPAGVNVKVDKLDPATLFGPNYGKWVSTVDVFGTRNYLPQVAIGSLPGAIFNTPQWNNPKFVSLYAQAMAASDESRRADIAHEMQQIEHDEGGYIIPMFSNFLDAHAVNVVGFKPDAQSTLNLNGYNFREVGFSS